MLPRSSSDSTNDGDGSKNTVSAHSSCAPASPSWITRLVLPLCLFPTALLAFALLNSYQNWGDDWAQYMLQAKAILDWHVRDYVQQNTFMRRESALPPGPVAYPWGLPLLLALEASLFS